MVLPSRMRVVVSVVVAMVGMWRRVSAMVNHMPMLVVVIVMVLNLAVMRLLMLVVRVVPITMVLTLIMVVIHDLITTYS